MEPDYVLDNSPSIEYTLRPILYICWLFGVGVARPRKCPEAVTIIICIVHFIICTFSLIQATLHAIRFPIDGMYDFMFSLHTIICYVSVYYYIYHGVKQYDKWSELMDKMKELDQKIKREIHINDQPLKNLKTVAIFATSACCLLLSIVFLNIYSYKITKDWLFYNIVSQVYIVQSMFNSLVFVIVVYALYYKSQMMNKLIGQLEVSDESEWIALKIRRLRQLHYDICDLVIMINDIYGLHLFLWSINCFNVVVIALFYIYISFVKRIYILFIIYFSILLIIFTMEFGLMCWICTRIRQEFDKTSIIICAILLKCKFANLDKLNETKNQLNLMVRLPMEDPSTKQNSCWCRSHNMNYVVVVNLLRKYLNQDWLSQNLNCVRNEINEFSIQLQHRRVAFTACDFFEINNAMFNYFVAGIITYVITFSQLYPIKKA